MKWTHSETTSCSAVPQSIFPHHHDVTIIQTHVLNTSLSYLLDLSDKSASVNVAVKKKKPRNKSIDPKLIQNKLSRFYNLKLQLTVRGARSRKLCDWMFVSEMHLGNCSWLFSFSFSKLMNRKDIF